MVSDISATPACTPEDVTQHVREIVCNILNHLRFRHFVTALSHSDYLTAIGGTEKVLHEEQAEMAQRKISYVQIYAQCVHENPGTGNEALGQVVGVNVDSVPVGFITLPQMALALRLLKDSGKAVPAAIHLHHLMNFSVPAVHSYNFV